MKVALVHEFLNQLGGAEKVLDNFLQIWPDATVHVILYNQDKTLGHFKDTKKKISWLQNFPLAKTHPRLLLVMMPKAIESFRFSDYDVVLSDASSFAKGVNSGDKLHICYCHTPTRFLWTDHDYLDNQQYPEVLKWMGRKALTRIRKWDYEAAHRPDFMLANSVNVQKRIKKYYNRDSEVVYPPIETDFYRPTIAKGDYFFAASRLEPYKKFDLLIKAFNELNLPLKVAGSGTVAADLKKMANPNIEFLGRVSDGELRDLYSGAKAFLFPAEEDAGMMMLEAQACGTPVIAYRAGGALELVQENITGTFFDEQTVESIKKAVIAFNPKKFQSDTMRANALKYDSKLFREKMKKYVEERFSQWKGRK